MLRAQLWNYLPVHAHKLQNAEKCLHDKIMVGQQVEVSEFIQIQAGLFFFL